MLRKKAVGWIVIGLVVGSFGYLTIDRSEDWKDEVTLWEVTIDAEPTNPTAHFNLGSAYLKKGMPEHAIGTAGERDPLHTALAIDPGFTEAHYSLGLAFQQLGNLSQSAYHYRKALTSDKAIESHANLGIVLFKLGNQSDAIMHFERALELRPGNPEVLNNLGLAAYKQGRYEDAVSHYHEALAIEPDFSLVHYNLGNTFHELGYEDEAIASYEKALSYGFERARIRLENITR